MLISKSWLADFVKINASTEVICDKLTALGLEVENVSKAAPPFSGVVVGKVLELSPHPDADKLQVANVDIGKDEFLQIVCGAPNVAVDMLAPVATVGAVLPGDFHIKQSTLRGVESFGMLCSESELGIADSASGLMALPADFEVGQDIRQALDLDDDIIEIGLTPNRGDCLSVLGVARELAVVFDTNLKDHFIDRVASANANSPAVTLAAPKSCPHYIARTISGINNQANSPLWLTERLRRAGIRALSPIVDVTNYVMLETGVPMHAFAASAINKEIVVRMASQGEELTLLDGKALRLDKDMLVIADTEKAIALAGIMGGENSAVNDDTTEIVLEAAWFAPEVIAGRARRIGLQTDASHRFERGVDFSMQKQAIERATQLIIDICGGKAYQSTVATDDDEFPVHTPITLYAKSVDKLLGVSFPEPKIAEILSALGLVVVEKGDGVYAAIAPNHRFDLEREEDLIEELARVWGYDNIPVAEINVKQLKNQAKQDLSPRRNLHTLLVDMGYQEAITYSFIDAKTATLLSDTQGEVQLMNSLSAELSVMRTSLLPGLTKALIHNVNRQQTDVRLYEWGHGYLVSGNEYVHNEKLAGVATGNVQPIQWGYRHRWIDFFDIKGDIESLFERLGVLSDISYRRSEHEFLHPGQSADVLYQGNVIGFVGTLHPRAQKALDIDNRVLAFELDIATLIHPRLPVAQPIAKYPEIRRDISILMAQGHHADEVLATIREASDELVTDVRLFDVYIGRNIPKNTKSMAIAIYLQDKQQTLTDERADDVIHQITTTLTEKFNAELRG